MSRPMAALLKSAGCFSAHAKTILTSCPLVTFAGGRASPGMSVNR
jgi:hypothetical protein